MRRIALLAAAFYLIFAGAWAQGIGVSSTSPTPSHYQVNFASSQTAPNSTSTYKTQGLGTTSSLAPTMTGTVLITISGTIYEPAGTAATIGIKYQIYYGTGTAPANQTSVASNCSTTSCTAVGVIQTHENGATITAADLFVPFSITALVTGLTLGTGYWFDLAAESVGTASDQGFSTVGVSVLELP